MSYSASYIIVIMSYFFVRIDYARSTIILSFLLGVAWIYFIATVSKLLEPPKFAIVPGGAVQGLTEFGDITWIRLVDPENALTGVTGVVADLRADLPDDWIRFIADMSLQGIPVYHVKQVRESLTGAVEIEHLSENTLGSLSPNRIYFEIKQLLDWLMALAALFVFIPLFVLVACCIRLDSRGSVLFTQQRRGFRGSTFTIYKFRTMHISGRSDGAALTSSGDQMPTQEVVDSMMTKRGDRRVTRVGRLLRRTRLDELPQIINILRGEMSWIGPRPEAIPLSKLYESELPFYSYRHIIRPGITGWAQVHQGHVSIVSEVHRKLHYDFYYIKNFSFWIDCVIVLLTIRTIFSGFGSR